MLTNGEVPQGPYPSVGFGFGAPWAEILASEVRDETVLVGGGGDRESKASQEVGRFGCAIKYLPDNNFCGIS